MSTSCLFGLLRPSFIQWREVMKQDNSHLLELSAPPRLKIERITDAEKFTHVFDPARSAAVPQGHAFRVPFI